MWWRDQRIEQFHPSSFVFYIAGCEKIISFLGLYVCFGKIELNLAMATDHLSSAIGKACSLKSRTTAPECGDGVRARECSRTPTRTLAMWNRCGQCSRTLNLRTHLEGDF